MNTATAIAARFHGFGGPCVAHGIRGCSRCILGDPPERPSLETQVTKLLDLLPLEDAWDELRADVVRAKLHPELDDARRRRTIAQLVDFHVARPICGDGWRAEVRRVAKAIGEGA